MQSYDRKPLYLSQLRLAVGLEDSGRTFRRPGPG